MEKLKPVHSEIKGYLAFTPARPQPRKFLLLPPLRAPCRERAGRGRSAGRPRQRPAAPADVERGGVAGRRPSPGLAAEPPAPRRQRGPRRGSRGRTHKGPSGSASPGLGRPGRPPPPRPAAARPAVPLASQSAQYLLSSSRSSLARMAWCCSFCFCAFSRQERVAMAAGGRAAAGPGQAGWAPLGTGRSCPGAATGTGCRQPRLPQPELLTAADASASHPAPSVRPLVCSLARTPALARARPPRPRQPCAGGKK